MQTYAGWIECVIQVLETGDEDACLAVIHCVGSRGTATVHLIEGDLTPREALSYARVMMELGNDGLAQEVVQAVVQAQLAA